MKNIRGIVNMVITHINNKLLLLPDLPGCYLMKNKEKEIIYIGKAKSLKQRVSQYFLNNAPKKIKEIVRKRVKRTTRSLFHVRQIPV